MSFNTLHLTQVPALTMYGCEECDIHEAKRHAVSTAPATIRMSDCRPFPATVEATLTMSFGALFWSCEARPSPHPSALLRPCMRPSERVRPAQSCQNHFQRHLEAVLTARNGPGRARTVANRAGTALTGAVRTGLHWPMVCRGAGPDRTGPGRGRGRPLSRIWAPPAGSQCRMLHRCGISKCSLWRFVTWGLCGGDRRPGRHEPSVTPYT